MTFAFEGAMVTAIRPQGFAGSPFALFSSSSCHVAPPSVVLKKPLPLGAVGPSPPERNVQPLPRDSHMPAKSPLQSCELTALMAQPVERFAPSTTLLQFFPPPADLQTHASTPSV